MSAFLPVPRKPRHDGWTPEKQWRFIEALATSASIAAAARLVGMSPRSALRLRRHPQADGFRAAWDAAIAQAWGQLERVALDRALNGETEVIEREGMMIGERHRPCSDRLMIHLLASRERALDRAHADRIAARHRALADADAQTAALAAFRAASRALTPWPAMEDADAVFDLDSNGQIPLAPDDTCLSNRTTEARPTETEFEFDTRPRWEDYR